MRRELIACITCDVEVDREEGLNQLRKIFDLLNRYNIKGTFFLLLSSGNYTLLEDSDLLSYRDRHEFGLHIHWGESNSTETSKRIGLESLPFNVLQREMEDALECCNKLGFRPKSFRGGGLSQTTSTLSLITRYGFKVDSSVASKLNEKGGWYQKHVNVPYRSWYFPSKKRYDVPASSIEDRIGVLEIPITRLIPSFGSWFPYTLEPLSPLFKVIVNEWLIKSHQEKPMLVTSIFHSWGDEIPDFEVFLRKLSRMIDYILKRGFEPLTLSQVYNLLSSH